MEVKTTTASGLIEAIGLPRSVIAKKIGVTPACITQIAHGVSNGAPNVFLRLRTLYETGIGVRSRPAIGFVQPQAEQACYDAVLIARGDGTLGENIQTPSPSPPQKKNLEYLQLVEMIDTLAMRVGDLEKLVRGYSD